MSYLCSIFTFYFCYVGTRTQVISHFGLLVWFWQTKILLVGYWCAFRFFIGYFFAWTFETVAFGESAINNIFEETFHGIFSTLRVFAINLLWGNCRKKIFFHISFWRCLVWCLNHSLTYFSFSLFRLNNSGQKNLIVIDL